MIHCDFSTTALPPDGDYLLTVSTGNGQSQSDEYDLTIGGVGPKGDRGDQGQRGDQGAQGEQGEQGGGGLQDLETITFTTEPFDLPNNAFTAFILATCSPNKLVLMGTCTDSAAQLVSWTVGGSGPVSQKLNPPGTGYTCRSRNTGVDLFDVTVTATAVCASLP